MRRLFDADELWLKPGQPGFGCSGGTFGQQFLGLVYGKFYRQGWDALLLLSAGNFFNVFAGPCGVALQMTGNQRIMMVITVFSGILSVAGGIFLVRTHGINGVAAATAGALIVQNALMLFYTKRRVGIWTMAALTPTGIRYLLAKES